MDPLDFDLRDAAAAADAYSEQPRYRGSNRVPACPAAANRGRERSRPAENTSRRRACSEAAAARPRQARRTDNSSDDPQASDDLPQQEQYYPAWQQQQRQQQEQEQEQRFAQQLREAEELVQQYWADAGPPGQRCRCLNGASACRLTTNSGGSKQGPFAVQCCSSRLGQMMQRSVRSVAPTQAQSGKYPGHAS